MRVKGSSHNVTQRRFFYFRVLHVLHSPLCCDETRLVLLFFCGAGNAPFYVRNCIQSCDRDACIASCAEPVGVRVHAPDCFIDARENVSLAFNTPEHLLHENIVRSHIYVTSRRYVSFRMPCTFRYAAAAPVFIAQMQKFSHSLFMLL